MTTDPIDLDAIEARAKDASAAIFAGDWFVVQRGAAARLARDDVPALLAEVRRLSDTVERVEWLRRSTAMDCDIVGGYCELHCVETDDEGRCGLVSMLDRALSP